MKKVILVFITIFLLISCNNENTQYEITGIVSGYNDSTVIYLRNFSSGNLSNNPKVDTVFVDSTFILNGQFKFIGQVNEPKLFAISINSGSPKIQDFTTLWIENTIFKFKADKGDFKNAEIIGGEIQKQANELKEKLQQVDKSIDSVQNVLINLKSEDTVQRLQMFYAQELLMNNVTKIEKQFIKDNPDYIMSAYVLSMKMRGMDIEETKSIFQGLSDKGKTSIFGREIQKQIQ